MLTLNTNPSRWTIVDIMALTHRLDSADIMWSFRWESGGVTLRRIDGIKITYNRDDDLARIIYREFFPNRPSKEIDMTASNNTLISDAEAQVARAIADLERAQANLAKAKTPSYPDEPSRHAVIAFTLTFEQGEKSYEFAARRVGDAWYTTGSTCPRGGYTWKALIDWMREAHYVTAINLLGYISTIEVN